MGLKADIDEVISSWSTSPWWLKVWLVISAFFTISTIASISEQIVKWRGFILDSILFYREWITIPVTNTLKQMGIYLYRFEVDIGLLMVLILFSFFRFLAIHTDWKNRHEIYFFIFLVGVMLALLCYSVAQISYAHELEQIAIRMGIAMNITNVFKTTIDHANRLMAVAYLLILLLPPVLRIPRLFVLYAPIVFAIFIVSILAAINAGLSR